MVWPLGGFGCVLPEVYHRLAIQCLHAAEPGGDDPPCACFEPIVIQELEARAGCFWLGTAQLID